MASHKEISILIVDDEEPIRQLLAAYLSSDYACVTAASADEATALLAGRCFNLILTDITMPGASGIELCQYVHQAFPETVVVMVSGLTDVQYAIEAMRHGAFAYVTKPFNLRQVLTVVDRARRYQALAAARRNADHSLFSFAL
jgi:DNA-binding NtrC family response regulator